MRALLQFQIWTNIFNSWKFFWITYVDWRLLNFSITRRFCFNSSVIISSFFFLRFLNRNWIEFLVSLEQQDVCGIDHSCIVVWILFVKNLCYSDISTDVARKLNVVLEEEWTNIKIYVCFFFSLFLQFYNMFLSESLVFRI